MSRAIVHGNRNLYGATYRTSFGFRGTIELIFDWCEFKQAVRRQRRKNRRIRKLEARKKRRENLAKIKAKS